MTPGEQVAFAKSFVESIRGAEPEVMVECVRQIQSAMKIEEALSRVPEGWSLNVNKYGEWSAYMEGTRVILAGDLLDLAVEILKDEVMFPPVGG